MIIETDRKGFTEEACDLFNNSQISDTNFIFKPNIFSAITSVRYKKNYKNKDKLEKLFHNFQWHYHLSDLILEPMTVVEMNDFITEVIDYYNFYKKEQKKEIINQKIEHIEKDFK